MATFDSVYDTLRKNPPPLLPPTSPYNPSFSHEISSLLVHPTLETGLHLLNNDLPSAHFLVRHMQAAPKYEGMYLHGILHRIEGDYDNARAWYKDVADSDVFTSVWGDQGLDKAHDLIRRVQDFKSSASKNSGPGQEKVREGLEAESAREIDKVMTFCRSKFGGGQVDDASDAWKQPEDGKVKQLSEEMIIGSKGHRKF